MRIVSLTSVYPSPLETGRGLFVRARLQHLPPAAQVKVIAPVWAMDRSVPGRRTDARIEVFHPRWIYIRGTGAVTAFLLFFQLIRPLRSLKKEFAFQVLDSHFGYPEGIAASLLATVLRVPFTVTLRGSELLHSRYPLRRVLMGWALKRASSVIAVSEQLRQFAIALGTDPARTRTISNGIDGHSFYPQDRNTVRLKHGLDPKQRIILSAGHLIELKGHHLAVRAVKRLLDRGVAVQLIIAGGPPGRGVASYEVELKRLITDLRLTEHVRLLGHVSRDLLIDLMSAADVFCLASSREGWPNVVHEALACGTPVVATRVGAIPELITQEAYGLVVEPDDLAALTDALHRSLTTAWNRSDISEWACSRTWEQVGREVLDEMNRAVSETEL